MSEKNLTGKGAVVTGSARGIGRAIALGLAARGASVVVNYVNSDHKAEEVAAIIREGGGKAVAVRADVTHRAQLSTLFDRAEQEIGPLDIVFANAGTATGKPVAECTEDDFERYFCAQARAAFFTLQDAARRVRDGGRIVATSSIGSKVPWPEQALYNGAKGAIEQFVRVLSRELAPRQVTVNTISPGFTDTDLSPESDREVAEQMTALGRMGQPKDIADVAVFLASEEARWVTGQNIVVDGGVTIS
jgi:3-oxoacyl-[acyl-carrier protein] reductase